MKIIKNEKLIKRNGKMGSWASLAGFVIVCIPVFFYVRALTQQDVKQFNFTILLVLTFGGLIVSQLGIYLSNRYGGSPSPDEKLDAGLKGLPGDYTIYHYTTPVPHLLVGPAGIWLLMPYHQKGLVTFKKNRWKIAGGGAFQSYMRFFGQENMGRPDIEIDSAINALKKHFAKKTDESSIPQINPLMVFTNDNVEITADDAPVPAMKLKQVKEFIRQKAKERKLSTQALNDLNTMLG